MRYKLAATDANVIATALHDFHGFMSKTCRQFMILHDPLCLHVSECGMQADTSDEAQDIDGAMQCTSAGIDFTICESVTPSGNCLPILVYPYW